MTTRTALLLGLSALAVTESIIGINWMRQLKQGGAAMLHADERMALSAQINGAAARAAAARKRLDDALDAPLEAAGGASIAALAGKNAGAGSTAFAQHFTAMLANPDFRKKLVAAQFARLSQEYGPLFAQLALNPEQQSKLQALLVDKQLAKSQTAPLAMYDDEIRALLGDKADQTFVHYEDTARLRRAVSKIAAGLSATDSPLAPETANQLVENWYAALPPEMKGHPTGLSAEAGSGLASDYELPALPANAAEIAQGLLTERQMEAFQRLIRAQRAQQRLKE
jgi:hypothetical protein